MMSSHQSGKTLNTYQTPPPTHNSRPSARLNLKADHLARPTQAALSGLLTAPTRPLEQTY